MRRHVLATTALQGRILYDSLFQIRIVNLRLSVCSFVLFVCATEFERASFVHVQFPTQLLP